jgi:phosphotransferase system  glucose/maltose/N-acetylglucosamine-specific IIC component
MLITLGIIFALMLGFSVSGLLVSSKLTDSGKALQGVVFVVLGSVVSVVVMVLMIFIVWPTHMVI